jgi:hypothetical protein
MQLASWRLVDRDSTNPDLCLQGNPISGKELPLTLHILKAEPKLCQSMT